MGAMQSSISREQLRPGDHIYSWRPGYFYAHHAIYVGDGKVIHFTQAASHGIGTGTVSNIFSVGSSSSSGPGDAPCPQCGYQSTRGGVISSCIDCFLCGGELYRYEYDVSRAFFRRARGGTCTTAASNPPEDVIKLAEFLLENGFGPYNLLLNNCEHFAIYCKTHTYCGLSGQLWVVV